jgi:UDP-N-acetylglucosamine diphosphorylase / glucose-1-phosphate thymidylyltransferase / UDP-N-acetylgalactosamine diphosphorylase / glucosamine-1-phosphate N-acetyltransferase / galactosamine-1-phosphate N-acetyltransferase
MSSICIFEDDGYRTLYPLTHFRASYDLRCGINTLFDKLVRAYPRNNVYLLCREYLLGATKKAHPGAMVGKVGKEHSVLFLNGRLLCRADIAKSIPVSGVDEVFECEGVIVAARLSKGNLELVANSAFTTDIAQFLSPIRHTAKTTQISLKLINYFFDLIEANKDEIKNDFSYLTRGGVSRGRLHPSVAMYQKGSIFIDDGVEIDAFVTLDARNGPIYISKGVTILPNSRVEGPCFLGERTSVATGTSLREGVSAGPDCRLGGEIGATIFQGRSNKSHYGFLGNSYICEWVNLGAGVTNSNLKNNYGTIRVRVGDADIDSGKIFLGCAIGDHTKIAIGSLINTGSVIGVVTAVFGGRLMPKFLPSFSWGEARQLERYDVEKAISTAKAVMTRRKVEFSDIDADLFRKVYELTEGERTASGIK